MRRRKLDDASVGPFRLMLFTTLHKDGRSLLYAIQLYSNRMPWSHEICTDEHTARARFAALKQRCAVDTAKLALHIKEH